MKKLLFFFALLFISVQSISQILILGGDPVEGALQININADASTGIYRHEGGYFQKQFFKPKGIRLFDGSYSYSSLYYQGEYGGKVTRISNTKSGNEVTTVVRAGQSLELVQIISYAPGSAELSYEWQIKNIAGKTLHDIRFFAGGDTYLAGGDKGNGYWDPATTTIGVTKFDDPNATSGEQRNLLFEAITIPYSYESQLFSLVKSHIISNIELTGDINTTYHDNAYALEWRKASMAADEVWIIRAGEKFITKTITDLNVSAPIGEKIKPGETIDIAFNVTKDKTPADLTTFATAVDLSGWTAVLKSASPVTLDPYADVDVVVSVTAPAGVALGTGAKVTLTATNSTGSAKDVAGVVAAEVPTVTSQPNDLVVCSYGSHTISLTAINADTYQWQEFNAGTWNDLTNGGAYTGVTTPSLGITVNDNAFAGNKYRCVITNATGQVQSRDALLTVEPLTIIAQPTATINGCVDGGSSALIVEAKGSGLVYYEWQKDGVTIDPNVNPTAQTRALVINNTTANIGTYTCLITTSEGCGPITTNDAVVNFTPLPTVTAPADATHCEGDLVTLTATVSGADSYTWDNGVVDGVAFPAPVLTTTYTVTAVKGSCTSTDQVTITVNPLPLVQAGVDKAICFGEEVTLKGEGTANTYVWDNGITDGVAFTPPLGSTTYTVTGTNSTTGCQETDQITISVNTEVIATSVDKLICEGESVDITATVSGGVPPYSYYWFDDTGLSIGTTATVTVTPGKTTDYRVNVTDSFSRPEGGNCSANAYVTVTVNPSINVTVDGATICNGSSATLSAHVTGGNGNFTYLWSPGGATTPTITVSPTTTTDYTVEVNDNFASSNGTTCSATSAPATVTVNPLPTISAGSNQTICPGDEVTLSGSGGVSYVWDNGVVDGQPFKPTATTTYTVTGTDANGCANTSSVTITITPLTTADAGNDAAICAATSYVLNANTAVNGAGQWSSPDNLTFADATSPTTTVSGLQTGQTHTLTWTITNNGCTSSDDMIIAVDALLNAAAGQDDAVCDVTTYQLKASAVDVAAGMTGTWSGGTGISFANVNDPLTTVSGLAPGPNVLTWTVSGGTCANSNDQVTITRFDTQPANAGTDQSVCEDQTTVTLAATAPTEGAGKWSSANPFVSFADPTSPTTTVTGLVLGTHTLTWTIINGICLSSDDVIITIERLPIVSAGPDASVCDDTDFYLAGQSTHPGVWTASDVNVTFDSPTSPSTIAHDLPAGATTFTWTVTDPTCGTFTDELIVTRSETVIADAGADIITCAVTTATLNAVPPTSGTGLWTSTTPGVVIDSPTSPTTNVSNIPSAAGFFWTVTNGSCTSTDIVTVIVNPLPPVFAGPPLSVCEGTPVTLQATGAESYTWDNGVIDGKEFIPTATQTYTVTGIAANGCSNTSQTTVTVVPIPVVDAGLDVEVCAGELVTLTATGADTYLWTDGVQNGVPFVPTATTTYIVTGISETCTADDSVTVTVKPLPQITDMPSYPTVCANTFPFELVGALPRGGTYSGTGVNANQWFDPVNAGTGSHIIVYEYTDPDTQCSTNSSFTITVDPLPTVSVLVDQYVCEDTEAVFVAIGADAYKWEGDSLSADTVRFTPPIGTFSQRVVGSDRYGCSSEATASTEIEKQPNAGTNNTVVLNASESTILDLFASLGGTPDDGGTWTDDDNSGADISVPTSADFDGVKHGAYDFTYLVAGFSCPDSSAVLEVDVNYVEPHLPFLPSEGFSPNGDGINDTWFIADIEEFPNNYVRIIDRAGAMVFEVRGYANDTNAFDGRANVNTLGGSQLPSGTYFYIIDKGDGSESVSGYFTLLR